MKISFHVVSAACLLAISFHNFLDFLNALQLLLCCLLSISKDYISHCILLPASYDSCTDSASGNYSSQHLCRSEGKLNLNCDTAVPTPSEQGIHVTEFKEVNVWEFSQNKFANFKTFQIYKSRLEIIEIRCGNKYIRF